MSKIFISYRGSDEGYQPEILKSTLSKYFNRKSIFYDFEDIKPGQDFEFEITNAIKTTEVMLVLIGKDWLDILNERSKQEDSIDYVKYEIEKGLEKLNNDERFQLFPVLFDGVKMPGSVDLPESIKSFHKRNPIKIEQGKLFEALDKLGLEVCRKVNSPSYCFLKKFKYYLLASLFVMVAGYFTYNYFVNKPKCEDFPSGEKLSILIAPDENEDYLTLEKVVFSGLDPYFPHIKSMTGSYHELSMGDLEDLAKPCGPSIMIKGNIKSCCMKSFDPTIEKYIIDNYSIHPSQFSICNTSLEKLACMINTFLSEKNNSNNVFSNPTCIQNQFNELAHKVEIKDTLNMMIGQSMANMYEKQGKLDSAMIILEKLSTSGGINPDSVYTRMARIASKTKNTAAEIIAKTGLIKQADKKGDENTKTKLQKDIERLNIKVNDDQGKVKLTSKIIADGKLENQKSPTNNETKSSQTNAANPNTFAPKINVSNNVKMYENLNKLINNGKYIEIENIYKKYKDKIDKDSAMLSLYYESMYKAKKISDSIIPEKILYFNQRLKTAVFSDKIKKVK